MSEVRLQLCRRYAACAVLCEDMESALAQGKEIKVNEFVLLSGMLSRLARRIGLDRVARNVTPDLQTYLRQKRRGNGNVIDSAAVE